MADLPVSDNVVSSPHASRLTILRSFIASLSHNAVPNAAKQDTGTRSFILTLVAVRVILPPGPGCIEYHLHHLDV